MQNYVDLKKQAQSKIKNECQQKLRFSKNLKKSIGFAINQKKFFLCKIDKINLFIQVHANELR